MMPDHTDHCRPIGRNVLVLAGAVLLAWLPMRATAQETPDSALSKTDKAFFDANWRKISKYYTKLGENYYACVNWRSQYASSMHTSVDGWIAKNSKSVKERIGSNLSRTVRIAPKRAEAEAVARTLPKLAVGEYGHIHSVRIDKVIGPQEMMVSGLWMIDSQKVFEEKRAEEKKVDAYIQKEREAEMRRRRAEQKERRQNSNRNNRSRDEDASRKRIDFTKIRQQLEDRYKYREQIIEEQGLYNGAPIKLVGFSTAGAVSGKRWHDGSKLGMQVAIVRIESMPSKWSSRRSGGDKMAVGVNAELFKKARLTEEDFKDMLAKRDLTLPQFVAFSKQVMAAVRSRKPTDPTAEGPGIDPAIESKDPFLHIVSALETRRAKVADKVAEKLAAQAEQEKLEARRNRGSKAPEKPKVNLDDWFKPKGKEATGSTTKPTDGPKPVLVDKPAGEGEPKPTEAAPEKPAPKTPSKPLPGSEGEDWFKKPPAKDKPES